MGILIFQFQEVYLLYSGKEIKAQAYFSLIYVILIFGFGISEMTIYLILFHHVSEHNKEMAKNKVISHDLARTRRQINVLSLSAQISGFITEAIFGVITLLTKVIERRFFDHRFRDYSNTGFFILYLTNSIVLIFASSELRKKFIGLFTR